MFQIWFDDIQAWSKANPRKLKALTEMPSPKTKRELQAFLGVINSLSKFSPSIADICESLRKLMSTKKEWAYYAIYQRIFDQANQS